MFEVKRVNSNIKQMVRFAFYEDKERIDKFHICRDKGLEACVEEEMRIFLKYSSNLFKLYQVTYFGVFYGWVGTDKTDKGEDFLTTFHLRKSFRDKENRVQFWNIIRQFFKGSFSTALYDTNSKAVNFIMRNGGEIVASHPYEGINILEFKIK